MKQTNKDDEASIATDLILLTIVLGAITLGLWWLWNNLDLSGFLDNPVQGTAGVAAGILGGLFNLGKDLGEEYNPVDEWRKNKNTEGRKWYYLYLR